MTRDEVNKVEYSNAPCLLKDGRMGSLIRSPRDDDDLCGVQVSGEEDIRWISFKNLIDRGGGALQEI